MFRTLKLDATRVYLFMEIAFAMFFGMVVVTNSLYEVTVAGLSALQLVLIGTMLEVSTFLFEVPTGIVADVYSRRLSIVIGYVLIGLGFLIEGLFPASDRSFWLRSSGPGIHFYQWSKTGLDPDEIGEESANKLFLRTHAWVLCVAVCIGSHLRIGANNTGSPDPSRCRWTSYDRDRARDHYAETGFIPRRRKTEHVADMWYVFKQRECGARAPSLSISFSSACFMGYTVKAWTA